ncbi:hypothetical protein H6F43_06985 [Leptolyngbya sp. FACHB-36]|uniref:hypothetical protein n=1 Tax=Leptolyngbya sp. FACHB-36 TaxID=2692808 RepID=UPI001680FC72|nr:hypothetical protein [Leptolyngbya sp. FACHB-36]MBD2019931.1 hypothetical protein [Leptolyngbya sp. FACHB-36]
MAPKNVNPKSLQNLVDRSAADNPGETKATTVRLAVDDLAWLDSLPEGKSYHVRQAVKRYRAELEEVEGSDG